jgi:hypothetical protein
MLDLEKDSAISMSITILVEFHVGVILLFKRLVGESHPLYRDD